MGFASKQFSMQASIAPVGKEISSLAVGALVKTTYSGADLVFKIADKNHSGYPANSVTLITKNTQSAKIFDSVEPSSYDANIRKYGNNRYLYSNLLQWLNKSGYPWFVAQHSYDAPPDESVEGFLTGFSSTFLSYLLNTNCITARNTVSAGGGSEVVTSKFYLPSYTEIGLPNENNIAEGNKLALFSDDSSRVASGGNYHVRTPASYSTYMINFVYLNGTANGGAAKGTGISSRPLCNIPSTTQISLTPDANGVYTIL